MYKIYKLTINNEIVYIGRTKSSLEKRKSSGYGKITELLKNSKIDLIEETDDLSRERYWIKFYRDLGFNLLNTCSGDGLNMKEYSKKFRQGNKDYYSAYRIKYYEDNKDYFKEYRRQYYLKNKK
jgi:hypothetical protein